MDNATSSKGPAHFVSLETRKAKQPLECQQKLNEESLAHYSSRNRARTDGSDEDTVPSKA